MKKKLFDYITKKLLIISTVSLTLVGSLYIVNNDLKQKRDDLQIDNEGYKRKTSANERELSDLRQQLEEINNIQSIFDNIELQESQFVGLKIDRANRFIRELQEKYHLTRSPAVDISTPEEKEILANDRVTVVKSDVTLKVESYHDNLILRLVENLLESYPGHVDIHHLNIKRLDEEMNEQIFERIRSGEKLSLVESEIEFEWLDVETN